MSVRYIVSNNQSVAQPPPPQKKSVTQLQKHPWQLEKKCNWIKVELICKGSHRWNGNERTWFRVKAIDFLLVSFDKKDECSILNFCLFIILFTLGHEALWPHVSSQEWTLPPLDFGPEVFIMRALWMCGITPPPAMVALIRVSSSSSPLIASCKCLGVILLTLRSLEALPASSKTSAVKYSRIAALYTAEVAPTLLFAETLLFKILWILPTGNYT